MTGPIDSPPVLPLRGRAGGFTIIELLVVIAIIGLLSTIAVPMLLGSREKARVSACDENYSAVVPEITVRLDDQVGSGSTSAAEGAIDALVAGHAIPVAHNPRNLEEDAYVDAESCGSIVPTSATACQVYLCFEGADTVVHQQYEGGELRTFSLTIE